MRSVDARRFEWTDDVAPVMGSHWSEDRISWGDVWAEEAEVTADHMWATMPEQIRDLLYPPPPGTVKLSDFDIAYALGAYWLEDHWAPWPWKPVESKGSTSTMMEHARRLRRRRERHYGLHENPGSAASTLFRGE